MKYLSLCSGIEAATVAFHPLGWTPLMFAEIEPFPSAVLAHHYPHVPNVGDMTNYRDWPEELLAECDMMVGGPPCQAFSVAGLRNSLDDERGNLTLTYVHTIDHIDAIRRKHGRSPVIALYENVPGLLSTRDNAFGCFLAGLAGEDVPLEPPGGKWTNAGYVLGPKRAVAWRVLDAQYFGVAQRRRRVFVVASAREGCCPAEILFEREGVRRDTPPSREKGEGSAGDVAACLRSGGNGGVPGSRGEHLVCAEISPTVTNGPPFSRAGNERVECEAMVVGTYANAGYFGAMSQVQVSDPLSAEGGDTGNGGESLFCMAHGQANAEIGIERSPALTCNHEAPIVVHGTQDPCTSGIAFAQGRNNGGENVVCFGGDVAFAQNQLGEVRTGEVVGTLNTNSNASGRNTPMVQQNMQVRRLTPIECERLQGFPDGYTNIPWRGKQESPDGPRYKALGNSMAVPVMRWIGERIHQHHNMRVDTVCPACGCGVFVHGDCVFCTPWSD